MTVKSKKNRANPQGFHFVTLSMSDVEAAAVSWLARRPQNYSVSDRKEMNRIVEKLLTRLLKAWERASSTGN